jgi:hypothetical protein
MHEKMTDRIDGTIDLRRLDMTIGGLKGSRDPIVNVSGREWTNEPLEILRGGHRDIIAKNHRGHEEEYRDPAVLRGDARAKDESRCKC